MVSCRLCQSDSFGERKMTWCKMRILLHFPWPNENFYLFLLICRLFTIILLPSVFSPQTEKFTLKTANNYIMLFVQIAHWFDCIPFFFLRLLLWSVLGLDQFRHIFAIRLCSCVLIIYFHKCIKIKQLLSDNIFIVHLSLVHPAVF